MAGSYDAMSSLSRLTVPVRFLRALKSLPRMLVPCQVIPVTMLFGNSMGVRGEIV
jgi:hypothetical protein